MSRAPRPSHPRTLGSAPCAQPHTELRKLPRLVIMPLPRGGRPPRSAASPSGSPVQDLSLNARSWAGTPACTQGSAGGWAPAGGAGQLTRSRLSPQATEAERPETSAAGLASDLLQPAHEGRGGLPTSTLSSERLPRPCGIGADELLVAMACVHHPWSSAPCTATRGDRPCNQFTSLPSMHQPGAHTPQDTCTPSSESPL